MKVKKVVILIVLTCICILLFVLTKKYLMHRPRKGYVEGNYTEADVEIIQNDFNKFFEDKITPRNLATLYSTYKGEAEITDLYKSLFEFENYLPELTQSLKNSNNEIIAEYYRNNQNKVLKKTGISNETSFIEFVDYIKKYDFTELTFEYCEIDTTSYKDQLGYLEMTIGFKYSEMDDMINFDVKFLKRKDINSMVIYDKGN